MVNQECSGNSLQSKHEIVVTFSLIKLYNSQGINGYTNTQLSTHTYGWWEILYDLLNKDINVWT